jgi:hypothetical protein
MKRIIIHQTDNHVIKILDNDDKDLQEYTKEISSLMELSNIAILETSQGNIIIKPSKILSIQVFDGIEIQEQIVKSDPTKPLFEDEITDR